MDKISARKRRMTKARSRMKKRGDIRLAIHRSSKHMYAQVIIGDRTVASASTLDKDLNLTGDKTQCAMAVGESVAAKAIAAGIKKVSYDRSGFLYHGRVKALAEGARKGGLDF